MIKKIFLFFLTITVLFFTYSFRMEQRSIDEIKKDIAKNSNNPNLYIELGDAYRSAKNLQNAKKAYEKVIKLKASKSVLAKGYAGLSYIARKENDYNKALDYAKKAAQLNPYKAKYKSDIGMAYYKLKKYNEAEKYFKKAVSMTPKKKAFYNNMLGFIYYKTGKYKKAIDAFQQVYNEKPWDKSIYASIARSYYKMGDKKKGDYYKNLAGDEWSKFKGSSEKKQKKRKRSKGWDLYKQKKYKKALSVFLKDAKTDVDAKIGLGLTYKRLKKYKNAIKVFGEIIKNDDSNAKAYLNRGLVYLKLKDYKKGIADMEMAVMLKTDDAFAHSQLGQAYLKVKNYNAAIKELNIAAQKKGDYFIYKALGKAYSKTKNFKNAVKYLKLAYKNSKSARDKKYLKASIAYNMYMYAGDMEKANKKSTAKKIYKELIKFAPKTKWAGYAKRRL